MAKKGGYFSGPRCYESHPPLPLVVGEEIFYITGGNCTCPNPGIDAAEVFVGLDVSMAQTSASYPWHKGVEFKFEIKDMSVPTSVAEFKKLITYLAKQVKAGKKVHVGCIGGHGRTGLVLSALVKHMMEEEDAISYVRKHYCTKAVETSVQINWLNKHFGIKKIAASKSTTSYGGKGRSWGGKDPEFWMGTGFYEGEQEFRGGSLFDDMPPADTELPPLKSVKYSYKDGQKQVVGAVSVKPVRVSGQIHGENL